MKRWLSLWAVLGFSTALFGKTNPLPGSFSVSAEWLYMLDAFDQPYYAQRVFLNAIDNLAPGGDRFANEQGWHSGYRLDGIWRTCDNQVLNLRWTHFPSFFNSSSKGSSRLDLGAILSAPPDPLAGDFAKINDSFELFSIDLLYQHTIFQCPPFALGIFGGLQYAHLSFNEKAAYNSILDDLGVVVTVNNRSKRNGVGPEAGFEMQYCIGCGFSAQMRTHAALLASKKERRFNQTLSNASLTASTGTSKDNTYWLIMPMVDMRIGVNYDHGFCFGQLNAELGYEFISYFRGVERINFTSASHSINEYMDFMLHGPYLQIGYCY